MGWIRTNLAAVRKLKAQLAEPRYTLVLPSGEEVTYTDQGLEDALGAAISREEHPLLDALRKTGATEGFEGLIYSLDRSWLQEEEEGT